MDYREHTRTDGAASEEAPSRRVGRRKAYEEVAGQIRERIFTAAVKTGEQLPTVDNYIASGGERFALLDARDNPPRREEWRLDRGNMHRYQKPERLAADGG